jgi:addiction module RelE/StbE family toxin
MRYHQSSRFKRCYKKLPNDLKKKTDDRLLLFSTDPFNPLLKDHQLNGEYADYRSINVTGDYRIMYERIDENLCLLVAVGTHPELYGN